MFEVNCIEFNKYIIYSKLGGYPVPKDTILFTFQYAINHDKNYWQNPHLFNPNRFLDESGKFISTWKSFLPFEIGKRICVGERFAMCSLFVSLCRLLQSTSGYHFALSDGPDSHDLSSEKFGFLLTPTHFEVKLIKNLKLRNK